MSTLHSFALYIHIIFGSAALLLFWISITAPKGGLNHVKFGSYYAKAMYTVAASGAITALIVLWDPLAIHGARLSNPEQQAAFVKSYRIFFSLLLYLSALIYASLRQGMLTLKYKQQSEKLRTTEVLLVNSALIISAPLLFYFGLQSNQKLAMIFSVLGLLSGLSNLKYAYSVASYNKAWLREHIGAMVGTGIGAHTAFFAFGGRVLFSGIGEWQLAFWIAPGVIGSFAIRYYVAKYASRKNATSTKEIHAAGHRSNNPV